MSLSINEMNELAFEKARLAYGKRRASRLFWVNTTMHELAEKLSGEEINQLIEKISAYNKRWWPARAVIRLFTSISKQRELLMYRLINDIVTALTQSADPLTTLREKQPMLNQIAQVGQRAPRFAWFRKTFATWQDWIAKKLNLNQAEEQPIVLDTQEAINRFRDQVQENMVTIANSYFAARENLVLNNPTYEKRRDAFDECFSSFRKLLREIQLKYHPDKIETNQRKTKEHGLSINVFRIEVEVAYKRINPIWQDFKERKDILQECMHQGAEQDKILAEIAAGIEEMRNPNSEYNKNLAKIVESIYAMLDEREKMYKEHTKQNFFELNEVKDAFNAMEANKKMAHEKSLLRLKSLDKNYQLAVSALAERGIVIPQPDPIVSTHPSALFAQNNVPSDNANVKENENTEIEKQAPTPNM